MEASALPPSQLMRVGRATLAADARGAQHLQALQALHPRDPCSVRTLGKGLLRGHLQGI